MAPFKLPKLLDKQAQVVFFSATAIALYGYDQGNLPPYTLQISSLLLYSELAATCCPL